MNKESIFFTIWPSPVGDLYLYADANKLLALTFKANDESVVRRLGLDDLSDAPSAILERTCEQLKEYFAGQRVDFDVPLSLTGTEFQQRAWAYLCKIPPGTTVSYKEQAARINSAGAIRAVGSANGKNPISIIVPCHRVLGSNGKVSGYSGGPEIKVKLLALEQSTSSMAQSLSAVHHR